MREECPCCSSVAISLLTHPAPHHQCMICGHRWRQASAETQNQYYSTLQGRNALPPEYQKRKIDDRLTDLRHLLGQGMKILEIGCAEGEMGVQIKAISNSHYTGVELSTDADIAEQRLDKVIRTSSATLENDTYDLLLAFHVLEHIPDVTTEMRHWRRILKKTGTIIVEVPKEAGHPFVEWDLNPEHLHQFTPESLIALCRRSGFSTIHLSSGHFESPVYCDSLRLKAVQQSSPQARQQALLNRFDQHLPDPFAVYGIGGDFRAYVEPWLGKLNIAALLDSNPLRHGEVIGNFKIETYNPTRHGNLKILASSIRHRESIVASLIEQGIDSARIVTLEKIYGNP